MKNQLKKQESGEIQRYFEYVLKKSQSGEQFPVDFDKVWPLVYTRKQEGVRDLREGGTQGVDYQFLRKNPENTSTDYQSGGRPSENYQITVPTLEWLIARKVRPVFEVYRRVFHEAVKSGSTVAATPDCLRHQTVREVNGRPFVEYMIFLASHDMSLYSGSVSRRRRNYPSEFVWMDGIWWVSTEFATGMDYAERAAICRLKSAIRSERLMPEWYKQGELPLNF